MKNDFPRFFNHVSQLVVRPQTVQRDEILGEIWSPHNNVGVVSVAYHGGSRAMYIEKELLEKTYNDLIIDITRQYKKGVAMRNYNNSIKVLRKSSKEVAESTKRGKNKQRATFAKWYKVMREDFYALIIAPFAVEENLQFQLKKILSQKYGDKSEKYYEVITAPTKLNNYQKLRKNLLELYLAKKDNDKNLARLASKYYWYNEYSYVEPYLNKDDLRKELNKLTRAEALNDLKKINSVEKDKKEFKTILKKIQDKEIRFLAQLINDYVFIRTDRIEEFKKAQAKVRSFYEYLAEELKEKTDQEWTLKYTASLLNEEIFDYLKKGKIPNFQSVSRRISGQYVYYYKNGKAHIINDTKLVESIQKTIIEGSKEKEIFGMISFKGIVTGTVCVIRDRMDLAKFKKGMIMVAPTTMPDFTPTMKLAKAIITDEGGITCHAAIISRELKIPCIVGTKIATKALKDGMRVEVDADKGIVKILK